MKKKIIALALCICLLAVAIVGGTMAYFTDNEAQSNTFTSGQVGLSLNEAIVEENADGDLRVVADAIQIEPVYIAPFIAVPMILILLVLMLISTSIRQKADKRK